MLDNEKPREPWPLTRALAVCIILSAIIIIVVKALS